MISRASNESASQIASARPLSDQPVAKQMRLVGKVARMPDCSIVPRSVSQPSSTQLAGPGGARKRGRPRVFCGRRTRAHAFSAARGGGNNLAAAQGRGSGAFDSLKVNRATRAPPSAGKLPP
eukprot:2125445-Pyramimonas_sp.AAC.1